MRKKIIAGNWKMNYTISEAEHFVVNILDRINVDDVDVVIIPSFVCLETVGNLLDDKNVKLGAQNVFYEEKGAYTGEVSADMLVSAFVDYVIVGHSERRAYFGETDEDVNKKVKVLLSRNIKPIICVGESLEQREQGKHFNVVKTQVINALKDVTDADARVNIVIAYEPIWAIGTGKTATADEANEMCKFIRDVVRELYTDKVADSVRVQYGGSVNAKNASEILNMPDIDGALVGGASLKEDFVAIVNFEK